MMTPPVDEQATNTVILTGGLILVSGMLLSCFVFNNHRCVYKIGIH
jgi:hypothetical protein